MYFKDIIDIKVSDNVTNVNAWAFYLCDKTKTISIGKNVSSLNLDWQMTKIKANLTAFNIDEANKNYKAEGNGIYIKNSEGKSEELIGIFGNVEEFHIPEGVKTIGVNAFNAANIVTIIIPNTLKTIKNHAFSHSTISEIRIPNSVNMVLR